MTTPPDASSHENPAPDPAHTTGNANPSANTSPPSGGTAGDAVAGADGVTYALHSHLARIEFYDAASGNALNPTTLQALDAALETAIAAPQCRVILIHGKGPEFCRGLDFQFVSDHGEAPPPTQFIGTYQKLLRRMVEAPQPVIALIDGAVKAGGVGLATAADIVIATPRTTYTLTEVIFGLVPFNVLPFLLRRVSMAKARYLILTCREVDASEAHRLGLIDELVRDAQAAETALRRLMKQLLRCSPEALAQTKSFSNEIATLSLDDACLAARSALEQWFESPANLAVLRDFQSGTTPPWFAKYKP